MRLLLDTHAFLWYVLDDPKLSAAAQTAINDPTADILVSPASYWEIANKVSINKYDLNVPFEEFWRHGIGDNDFDILPIEIMHAGALVSLPIYHKDPFDRSLVAQAIVEKTPLISADPILDGYPITRIW